MGLASDSRPRAFVTGASTGIGHAIAIALAREGYDLAISSTKLERLSAVTRTIEQLGCKVVAVELDVRSNAAIEQAVDLAFEALGGLECLVNNAGISFRALALDVTRAQWDDVIATNLTGAFFLSQAVARRWVEAKQPGAIVQMASTHGLVGFATRSVYGISKGAMIQMVRMLAIEWAEHDIRVNAIAPGTVLTESRAVLAADPAYRETMLGRVPLKQFASVEDVAAAACYLASPQAAYITGQTLVLDGGLTAQ